MERVASQAEKVNCVGMSEHDLAAALCRLAGPAVAGWIAQTGQVAPPFDPVAVLRSWEAKITVAPEDTAPEVQAVDLYHPVVVSPALLCDGARLRWALCRALVRMLLSDTLGDLPSAACERIIDAVAWNTIMPEEWLQEFARGLDAQQTANLFGMPLEVYTSMLEPIAQDR